ncbi:MAG TPA: hypothetical protein VK631_04120 [Solirubrobacteraceae bacterium]|nr:hypothetical protein [Solirubrobacteraceae bacterium]
MAVVKLTGAQARGIVRRYRQGGITHAALAEEHGVSEKLIWRLVHGKGYGLRRGEHRTCKLSDSDVRAIRQTYAAGGVRQRELAERYGVSQTAISLLVLGRFRRAAGGL